MKVFLDTNVLVAAFATRGLCADLLRLILSRHELVFTAEVRAELERALHDKLGLAERQLDRILELLDGFHAEASLDPSPIPRLRDPSDVPIARSALAAGADVLVTGDRDLLEAHLAIPVLTPRAFWEMLRRSPSPGEEVNETPGAYAHQLPR